MVTSIVGGAIIGIYTATQNLGIGVTFLLGAVWGLICGLAEFP